MIGQKWEHFTILNYQGHFDDNGDLKVIFLINKLMIMLVTMNVILTSRLPMPSVGLMIIIFFIKMSSTLLFWPFKEKNIIETILKWFQTKVKFDHNLMVNVKFWAFEENYHGCGNCQHAHWALTHWLSLLYYYLYHQIKILVEKIGNLICIHSKSGCPGCPDSAENSNFPQKDCLRTQKLSVSVPES